MQKTAEAKKKHERLHKHHLKHCPLCRVPEPVQPPEPRAECPDCGGHGRGSQVTVHDHCRPLPLYQGCEACNSTGKVRPHFGRFRFGHKICSVCHGSGKVEIRPGGYKKFTFTVVCKTCGGN